MVKVSNLKNLKKRTKVSKKLVHDMVMKRLARYVRKGEENVIRFSEIQVKQRDGELEDF